MSYTPGFDELRSAVDAELERFLAASRAEQPEGADLVDEIERLAQAGGKRLRPLFAYWGHRAAGGNHSSSIVRAAAALELLHTFAIVHDDIMDATLERRGVETSHARHGVDVGILVGDLALVLADAALVASGFSPEIVWRAFEGPYSRMRRQVIGGQYLEITSDKGSVDEATARRIAVLKSGRYSVSEPLAIGATLAGATADVVTGLERFGDLVGEAFQLRDDILGTFGTEGELGKPVDSDIRQGKHNVLFAKASAGLKGNRRDWFLSRWGAGDELSEDDVARLRKLIDESGAKDGTEALIADLGSRADSALSALSIEEDARSALAALKTSALDRFA